MHYFPKMTVIEIKNIKDESISISLTKRILNGFIIHKRNQKGCLHEWYSQWDLMIDTI